jgi:hypothetical protein
MMIDNALARIERLHSLGGGLPPKVVKAAKPRRRLNRFSFC